MAIASLGFTLPAKPAGSVPRKAADHIPPSHTRPRSACKRTSGPAPPQAFSSHCARPSVRSSRQRSLTGRPMLHSFSAAVPRLALQSLLFAAAVASAAVFAGAGAAGSAFSGSSERDPAGSKNVYGGELQTCSTDPMTGYFRDGRCDTGPMDFGTHTVCAKVTREFLEYTRSLGNDLVTPRPEYRFPGLKEGDGWCLCASRWREAMLAGVAPPVDLAATHDKTLQYVELAALERHSATGGSSTQ